MVAATPLLPTLPALDWDPTELAGEGIGERGDGVPVLLGGGREERTGQSPVAPRSPIYVSGTTVQDTKFHYTPAKMITTAKVTPTRKTRHHAELICIPNMLSHAIRIVYFLCLESPSKTILYVCNVCICVCTHLYFILSSTQ